MLSFEHPVKGDLIDWFAINLLAAIVVIYVLCMPLRRVHLNKVGVIALCKSSPMDFQCPLSEYIYHGGHNIQ